MPEPAPVPRHETGAGRDVDVLVVGAGPTGLAAANLLGSMGVRVLLIEQNAGTSDDAKAISLDDESLRIMQLAGMDDAVYPIILPGTGTRYFGARRRLLLHARGRGIRYGHPFKSPFAQPDLERVLRSELDRFPAVEVRFATRLVDLEQHPNRVDFTLQGADGGPAEQFSAGYLLGCDGGRSTVRDLLSIPMRGHSFDEVWLVADTLQDPHDQRYGMHVGDPDRPHVIVPGRDGRCRYEFLLRPGEGEPGAPLPFTLLEGLLKPYRAITPEQVERLIAYRFHALLADRLRDNRCFLLGDAAHMMPPFAGQGLNSGLRDAANLYWKVAAVLAGGASDELLDTYETERRPHAKAMIELSVRLGRIVMTTDRRRAWLRDRLVGLAMHTPRGRRYFTEMRYRPPMRLQAGAVVTAHSAPAATLVGTMLPQPRVLHGAGHRLTRLDDVLGHGWSLLGIDLDEKAWQKVDLADLPTGTRVDVVLQDRVPRARPGRDAVADADGQLEATFAGLAGNFVLVRPDRLVAAAFPPAGAARIADHLRKFAAAGSPDPDQEHLRSAAG